MSIAKTQIVATEWRLESAMHHSRAGQAFQEFETSQVFRPVNLA
jgi:hypothetical protein